MILSNKKIYYNFSRPSSFIFDSDKLYSGSLFKLAAASHWLRDEARKKKSGQLPMNDPARTLARMNKLCVREAPEIGQTRERIESRRIQLSAVGSSKLLASGHPRLCERNSNG